MSFGSSPPHFFSFLLVPLLFLPSFPQASAPSALPPQLDGLFINQNMQFFLLFHPRYGVFELVVILPDPVVGSSPLDMCHSTIIIIRLHFDGMSASRTTHLIATLVTICRFSLAVFSFSSFVSAFAQFQSRFCHIYPPHS